MCTGVQAVSHPATTSLSGSVWVTACAALTGSRSSTAGARMLRRWPCRRGLASKWGKAQLPAVLCSRCPSRAAALKLHTSHRPACLAPHSAALQCVGGAARTPGSHQPSMQAQVHFVGPRPAKDTSGVRLTLTPDRTPFLAGMMMYASTFHIPPGRKSTLVANRCCLAGFQPAHGFAFRVHTHQLGRSVFQDRCLGALRTQHHRIFLPLLVIPCSSVRPPCTAPAHIRPCQSSHVLPQAHIRPCHGPHAGMSLGLVQGSAFRGRAAGGGALAPAPTGLHACDQHHLLARCSPSWSQLKEAPSGAVGACQHCHQQRRGPMPN